MHLVSSAARSEVSMIEPVYAASAIADAGTMPRRHAELGARPVSMKNLSGSRCTSDMSCIAPNPSREIVCLSDTEVFKKPRWSATE